MRGKPLFHRYFRIVVEIRARNSAHARHQLRARAFSVAEIATSGVETGALPR
jgi:hypothetical protein